MFKKIAIVAAVSFSLAASAQAQGHHQRGGHHQGGHYHGGHGGGWVGPFVGGAIVGGIIGSMTVPRYYAPPLVYVSPPVYAPVCHKRFLGYDAYGQPVHDLVCH